MRIMPNGLWPSLNRTRVSWWRTSPVASDTTGWNTSLNWRASTTAPKAVASATAWRTEAFSTSDRLAAAGGAPSAR